MNSTEIKKLEQRIDHLENALQIAIDRIEDMLIGDDGQAWKEAEKWLPKIKQALQDDD